MKRSELKRKTPLQASQKPLQVRNQPVAARTPLKAVSDARRAQAWEREKVRKTVFARDDWRCQAAVHFPDVPCGGGLDCHEPKTRARGGDYLDPDACVTVCRFHHSHIHDHPTEATAVGMLTR